MQHATDDIVPGCRSSVVEHSIGNGEVESSILSGSTMIFSRFFNVSLMIQGFATPLVVHRGGTHGVANGSSDSAP